MMQNAVKNNSKALLTSLFRYFLFFEKVIVMGPKGPGTGTERKKKRKRKLERKREREREKERERERKRERERNYVVFR